MKLIMCILASIFIFGQTMHFAHSDENKTAKEIIQEKIAKMEEEINALSARLMTDGTEEDRKSHGCNSVTCQTLMDTCNYLNKDANSDVCFAKCGAEDKGKGACVAVYGNSDDANEFGPDENKCFLHYLIENTSLKQSVGKAKAVAKCWIVRDRERILLLKQMIEEQKLLLQANNGTDKTKKDLKRTAQKSSRQSYRSISRSMPGLKNNSQPRQIYSDPVQ